MNVFPPGLQDVEAAAAHDDRLDLRVWLRLLSCANMLEAEIRRRLRKEFGVTLPWFDAMAQLYRAPKGLTMSELSRRLMVTNGNVTNLVDRLVAEGHVTRKPEPRDQRVQRAALTKKGRNAFERMYPAHRRWISELLSAVDATELNHVYETLASVKKSVVEAVETDASSQQEGRTP